jgi:sulfonate transport system substrate-binding protein
MDRQRRRVLTWVAGAAVTPLLAPRRAGAAGASPAAVRIAGGASSAQGQIRLTGLSHVLAEQGWLEAELTKRGVRLEWFTTAHAATGPMINDGFANGTVDFAAYGDLPSAILNANGVETKLVVPHGLGQGDAFLVVPADSPAKTIDDLKGKRLAVHRGRPWEIPLLRLLASRGLSYADFKLFNINPQAGMAALSSNHVDALLTMTDAYLLEDKHVGRIIWSTKDLPLDWKTRTELWAAKSFIDAYPEATQVVVTAYVKAAYWASQEQNREAVIHVATSNGTPESVVLRSYQNDHVPWKDRWSPLFNDLLYDHYRTTVSFALKQDLIRRPVDVDAWFDKRWVAAALRELHLETYWQPVNRKPA